MPDLTPEQPKVLYRFFDGGKDESGWLDGHPDYIHPHIQTYRIFKTTPCGYWFEKWAGSYCCANGLKFTRKGTGKRYAYPTVTLALESYRLRKQLHLCHAHRSLAMAKTMLTIINNPNFDPEDCFPQVIF